MIHVLVSSRRPELVDELRETAPPSVTFLPESGLDGTLERLGRSARIDAVVTDDAEILAAIREEIPGRLPVYLAGANEDGAAIWKELALLLEA